MKKTVLFFLILIFSIFSSNSEESENLDFILLFDTSKSMFQHFQEVSDYATGQLIHDYLNYGDTIHLISFSENKYIQISRKINTKNDLETVIGRMLLMYPIDHYSDYLSALNSLKEYLYTLPKYRKKIVVLLSDIIFNPPAESKYFNISPDSIKTELQSFIEYSDNNNIDFYLINIPFTEKKLTQRNQLNKFIESDAITDENIIKSNIINDQQKIRSDDQNHSISSSSDSEKITSNKINEDNSNTKNIIVNTIDDSDNLKKEEENNLGIDTNVSTFNNIDLENNNEKHGQGLEIVNQEDILTENIQHDEANKIKNKKNQKIIPKAIIKKRTNLIFSTDFLKNIFSRQKTLISLILICFVFAILIFIRRNENLKIIKNNSKIIKKSISSVHSNHTFIPLLLKTGPVLTNDQILNKLKKTENKLIQGKSFKISNKNTNIKFNHIMMNTGYKFNIVKDTDDTFRHIKLHVYDQNTNIGKRNIHRMKAGTKLTVGGGSSHFLIFLMTVPYRLAEIYFNGQECIFIPYYAECFPELFNKPLFDCIGKDIMILTKNGHNITIRFEIYEDPLIKLNRMLHCIESPGIIFY